MSLKFNLKKFNSYVFPIFILLALEFFIYQSYFFIPVNVNGESLMTRKKSALRDFLKTVNKTPKYGNLVSIEKEVIKKSKGNAPFIKVNGVKRTYDYRLKPNDKITTFNGADIVEPLIKVLEPIQKPIENSGSGAFIFIQRKGKLGVKELTMGKYSKKVIEEKIISEPIPTGISRINIRKRRVIALTFDDGPSKYTPRVLQILKKYKVKATFFPLGIQAKKFPRYINRIKKNGHTIGNHTNTHINLSKSTDKLIRIEINRADHWIYKATKVRTKWFRPPGGALRQSVINSITLRGKNIAMWNIDTVDWKKPPPEVMVERVISQLKPGQVVLMHDGGGDRSRTVAALSKIIEEALDRKYEFVTLDELYKDFRPEDY